MRGGKLSFSSIDVSGEHADRKSELLWNIQGGWGKREPSQNFTCRGIFPIVQS